jgi:WXG100 family type VII secretion target
MNAILVDHATLDRASGDLRAAVAALDARLQQLSAELAPLATDWEGEAQSAYIVAKVRWDAAIHELRMVLAQAQAAVAASNEEYAAADRRGARAFGG